MCGITAVALSDVRQEASLELIEAAYTLQHRGQDSCGIATGSGDSQSFRRRGTGLVSEVFGGQYAESLDHLHGNIGIAHGKYLEEACFNNKTNKDSTIFDDEIIYPP